MMKNLILQQQQQQQHPLLVEENMSKLTTSASGEGFLYSSPHQSTTQTQSMKRKRSLPGNPGLN